MNTLFSYFKKKESPNVLTQNCQNVAKCSGNGTSPKQAKAKAKKSTDSEQGDQFSVGDLVWAKLEGYPWWPSLVCNHPTQNSHVKQLVKPSSKTFIHVQFFDDPPSRSWINLKYVKLYIGSDAPECHRGGQFFTTDRTCRKGLKEADAAMKLSPTERLSQLLVDLQPSDEDEEDSDGEDDEPQPMEFDADIFDNEMSDSDDKEKKPAEEKKSGDDSKENIKEDDIAEKTPTKQEKEGRRPHRGVKRRKIIEVDSEPEDSEEEFKPGKDEQSDEDSSSSSGVDEEDVSDIETESDVDSPVKKSGKRKRKEKADTTMTPMSVKGPSLSRPKSAQKQKALAGFLSPSTQSKPADTFSPTVSDKTKSKLHAWSAPTVTSSPGPGSSAGGTVYFHQKQEFLEPDKIRDIEKRKRNDPDYDPRTLHIPDSFKKNQTPAMKQWWDMKEKHFDTVLFFKMGKFYELYHMDADIGVKELGLIYMKGDVAHSGFPEIAFGRYSDTLIQKGYKVARVEQTETPEMMNERVKNVFKPTKFDKVVKREICKITTKATKTYSFIDGDASNPESSYLMAVTEKDFGEGAGGSTILGVCFVDTSVGKFYIGQFEDDRHLSCLRTLFAHYAPSQVLYERGKLSARTSLLMKNNLPSAMKDALKPGAEFWECERTLKYLVESEFFCRDGDKDMTWPEELKAMLAEGDGMCMSPAEGCELAVSALGAITWYLKECCLDEELLSLRNFETYKPPHISENCLQETVKVESVFSSTRQKMVLDGVTLANLDVLRNTTSGTLEGSLLEKSDHCITPFGKRLFQQWLCTPLCNPAAINDRLDALDDLQDAPDVLSEACALMKKIPDLERLISKIHTLGSASRSKNHPDSRAIFYEDVVYSKRKIEDFLSALEGFKLSLQVVNMFKDAAKNFKSKLLKQTIQINTESGGEGRFPDLSEKLDILEHAFDHNQAKSRGVIIPNKGVHPEYDLAQLDIKRLTRELDEYLDKQRTRLANRSIVYWGTGKNRYQLEVPESSLKRVPDEYEVMSQKKGYKRYKTKDIERMLNEMIEAEDRRDSALKDTMRKIFSIFDESYREWEAAVQCMAVLDVLVSMMQYSHHSEGEKCRPEFILPSQDTKPFLEIREGRHPCLTSVFSGDDFIPNDTVITIKDEADPEGCESDNNSSIVLVTGPNMGGKSTLMRQVGLIVIMAQMGLHVPAEKCRLTPVDRVFTRLGASDRIMAGESTFFVELSETSCILKQATEHSLVLFDELGRGTATYDGTAIACAVVQHLSQNVHCRTLFSTHYHSLVEEFSHDPNIRLGHMACMVENDNEDDPSQETITFLYKFVKGACPKSYGFNAARLALLPESVIRKGQTMSRQLEASLERMKQFRKLYQCQSGKELMSSI